MRAVKLGLAILGVLLVAIALVPRLYVGLLPAARDFSVRNDTSGDVRLVACNEHCIPSIELKPAQSWMFSSTDPVHAVYVYGFGDNHCFRPSGHGTQAFLVSRTTACPLFGGPPR